MLEDQFPTPLIIGKHLITVIPDFQVKTLKKIHFTKSYFKLNFKCKIKLKMVIELWSPLPL